MKVYVASSWRNKRFNMVLRVLDNHKISYYNFREGNKTFHWGELDTNWESWFAHDMVKALDHNKSKQAFKNDFNAMKECDACLLVHPCGRSAHLEAGWFVGQGKPLYVLVDSGDPDLMLKMADMITPHILDITRHIQKLGINKCG